MQILYLDFRPRRTGWLLSMQERLKLALAQILLVGRDRPSSRFSRHPLADLLASTPPHDQAEHAPGSSIAETGRKGFPTKSALA